MRKGFTLIELLFVLVIIGVIGTLGYQKFMDVTQSAKAEKTASELKAVTIALQRYYKDTGTFPLSLKYLVEKPDPSGGDTGYDVVGIAGGNGEDPEAAEYWGGPYLKTLTLSKDNENCVSFSAGRMICLSAEIASNNAFGDKHLGGNYKIDDVLGSLPPSAIHGGGSGSGGGSSTGSSSFPAGMYYNVLTIAGMDMGVAKKLVQVVNGKNPPSGGNLLDVANDKDKGKIGVPSSANYSKYKSAIYRFAYPF